ncbi:hypothetical protein EG329_003378 [Mollisiaceae sp. DMI_Dod_QoI]|nr:hypothetical protein EG329_003378 [Helotiales sp. DMI_Dod_QoI]
MPMFKALRDALGVDFPRQNPSTVNHRHLPTSSLSKGHHSAPDVAMKVIHYTRRIERDLNPRQKSALARYRSKDVFSTRNIGQYSESTIFNAYFRFFDDMFFGGLLKLRCTVVFTGRDGKKLGEFGESSTHGTMVDGRAEGVYGTIRIHEATHLKNDRERRLWGLGTLLHEMLHCFFDFYTCFIPSCRDSLPLLGKEHGFAWQDAAYALKLCVQDPSYLNLPLKLDRCGSLVDELREWGNPHVKDLGRWGFTQKDLRYEHGRWKRLRCDGE